MLLQLIFVRRGEQESRDYTVREIRRRAESEGDWPHVLIYPEGTYNECPGIVGSVVPMNSEMLEIILTCTTRDHY